MFSSTPSMSFSTSAFGSPLLFGQTSNSNASSTIPFGSQFISGQSSSTNIFGSTTSAGGTSMGLFGSIQGTPLWGSSSASISSSTNGFGSRVGFGQSINPNVSSTGSSGPQYTFGKSNNLFGSAPNFGGTSMGVFGQTASRSSFGQSSNLFGSAPNNGGTSTGVFRGTSFGQSSNLFGSAPNNGGTSTCVFGGTSFGQSSNIFGSAPSNGGTSTGVFGGTSFGKSSKNFASAPNNGGTSMGIFGQTVTGSSCGQSSNLFGSAPNNGGTTMGVFGQTTSSSSFGQSTNLFGSVPNTSGGTSMGVFGVTASPFSSASIATSSSPIIWGSSTGSTTFSQVPASIASSSPGFGSGCMTTSAQATVPWGRSSLSGTTTFCFGTQNSFYGNQVKAPIFGPSEPEKSSVGVKRGSRVTSYTKTTTTEVNDNRKVTMLSISAMPAYEDKSHEELRWEDHHQFSAGGGRVDPVSVQSNAFKNPFSRTDNAFQSPIPPSVPSNLFSTTVTPPSIGQYSFQNPVPPSVPSNPIFKKVTTPSIGQYSFQNPVPPSVPSNPIYTTVTTPSVEPKLSPSLDAAQPSPAPFSPLINSNPFFNNSCSATSTLVTQPVSISEPNKSPFTYSLPAPIAPQYPSINSSSAGAASCLATIFPSQSQTGGFSISSNIDCFKGVGGQTTFAQQFPSQNTEVKQSPIANPFGTPSAVPQMLAEGTRTAPPVRYGISSIPVCDKPAPARSPSLLNIRHLTYHRQKWLPIQKYKPKSDGPKVAFFDAQKTHTTAKKEAPLLPRSNPRAFIAGHYEELDLRVNNSNTSLEKHTSIHAYKNGKVEFLSAPVQDGSLYQDKDGISSETDAAEHNLKANSVHGDHPLIKESSSNVYELMPKFKHSDYFVEPRVEELAIKESYEPGFCSHVKGFVVGRHGYGSIKFLEETDVRELDLESVIEFRNREVIVYMDESKKPPVGQGLNKAAEITLCNIKVVDKKTGKQYTNGPNVDKFKEKLMKKAAEQGAEFVSYDPVQGEWKLRVQHF